MTATDITPPPSSEPPVAAAAPILPIFLIVLVDVFGMTLVLPLLAPYAEHYKATALAATMLVSVYAACQLVSGPLLGQISDRIGRKPLLLLSQAGTLIGFIVLARATTLWVIYLSRIIDGATAGNLSLAQAYISDNTEPKNRTKAFAMIGIAFGVGFLIGPSLTGFLADNGKHLARPIRLAAFMSLLSIVCTATLLHGGPPRHSKRSETAGPGGKRLSLLNWSSYLQYFRRPALGPILLEMLCFLFAFSLFTSGFALFAEKRFTWHGHPFTTTQIGYVFGFVGFLGILLQGGLVARLANRFGEAKLAKAGFVSLAIGYLGLGLASTIPELLIVATISSFGTGVLRPALTSLITQRTGRHEQGVVLGLNQSLMSISAIFAPILAGELIGRGWLAEWAWAAGLVGLVGFLIVTPPEKSSETFEQSVVSEADQGVVIPAMQAPSTGNS